MSCIRCIPDPQMGITHAWQDRRFTHFRRDFPSVDALEEHLKKEYASRPAWLAGIGSHLAWKRTDMQVCHLYAQLNARLPPELQENPPL